MRNASRREFLKSSITVACAAGLAGGGLARASSSHSAGAPNATPLPPPLAVKKGVVFTMAPEKLSYAERFKMIHHAGFEVVQVPTEPDQGKAEEIGRKLRTARTCASTRL